MPCHWCRKCTSVPRSLVFVAVLVPKLMIVVFFSFILTQNSLCKWFLIFISLSTAICFWISHLPSLKWKITFYFFSLRYLEACAKTQLRESTPLWCHKGHWDVQPPCCNFPSTMCGTTKHQFAANLCRRLNVLWEQSWLINYFLDIFWKLINVTLLK